MQYGPDFNFDTACDTGIKTEVKFPSWCVLRVLDSAEAHSSKSSWDGVNLYKPDQSHMNVSPHAW
jgi:hypothetical protein